MRKFLRIFTAVLLAVSFSCGVTTATASEYVYLSGEIVGIAMDAKGPIIAEVCEVETSEGSVSTVVGSDVRRGDVVVAIDGCEVKTPLDLEKYLQENAEKEEVALSLLRKGETVEAKVFPQTDVVDGKRKLGLWLRSHTDGIGTVTCVQDGVFYALGHAICEESTGIEFPLGAGRLFRCEIVGIERGTAGHPGAVRAAFSDQSDPLGEVEANSSYGICGSARTFQQNVRLQVVSRDRVKRGAAQIFSTVSGELAPYNIEIIHCARQSSPHARGLVFRVTDEKLLALTGGIVQGMSGSPIVQNGKLVGAVTHVFTNDPQRGYGVYFEWMKQK